MSRLNRHYAHVAQVTLEALTPLSIKADDADPTLDVRLVRDARGLPTLPGTSLAGVLRHLYARSGTHDGHLPPVEQVFGAAHGESEQTASALTVSFGYVHDAGDRPLRGPIQQLPDAPADDEVLALLQNVAPVLRDQVAINEYGTALDKAKIDRSALPRGTRFTFEMVFYSDSVDRTLLEHLVSLLHHPLFRLGGLTHRGFGAVSPVRTVLATFNLAEQLREWHSWRHTPWHERRGEAIQAQKPAADLHHVRLELEAEDFWRVGEGEQPLGRYDKAPDLCPWHEPVIQWNGHQAQLKRKQVVVPASGIKGALRHRTVFHYLRLTGGHDADAWQAAQQAMQPLFGSQADHAGGTGGRGALVLDDIYLEGTPRPHVLMHNAIDRFTGGVRRGALFAEEVLWKDRLTLNLWLKPVALDAPLREAFQCALNDLAEGRMNLGADFARGHGFFRAVGQWEGQTLFAQMEQVS